ncbi:uncharacterized protein LOC141613556 [Silene latifolia]|uniref:uncharacterized protein LOC141613556 n=1 Tax=Silene latifolia TaxID=37657 RepID=UPI003D76AEBF
MDGCGAWNIRGLNNPAKQKKIRRFLLQNKVGLFGLVETKIRSSSWNKARSTICDQWSICTNFSLHKGGIFWLMWDPLAVEVDISDVTNQCIHAKVYDKARMKKFWYTVVYGFNKVAERETLWSNIRRYHGSIQGPWIICGDFNAVMGSNERIGGNPVTHAEIRPLLQLVLDCNLVDLKAKGNFFTWNNKHETGTKVYSKIDRVWCIDDWMDNFPTSYVHFLPEGMFDHSPCLVKFDEELQGKRRTFKYFNMWALAKEFEEIVTQGWSREIDGTAMYRVVLKLRGLKEGFK